MSLQTELEITLRTDIEEKNNLLRKNGNVPGILYGNNEDSVKIQLLSKDLRKALEQPSIFSQIINLKESDKEFKVLLKDVQVNPANDEPIHVDFQRVSGKTKLTLAVPIKYINEDVCVGVKNQGGMLSKNKNDIELIISQPSNQKSDSTISVSKVAPEKTLPELYYQIADLEAFTFSRNLAKELKAAPRSDGLILLPSRDREIIKFKKLARSYL
mgnify:CR=1 FL=1